MFILLRKYWWIVAGVALFILCRGRGTKASAASANSAYRKADSATDAAIAKMAGAAAAQAQAATSKAASYVKDSLMTPTTIWD